MPLKYVVLAVHTQNVEYVKCVWRRVLGLSYTPHTVMQRQSSLPAAAVVGEGNYSAHTRPLGIDESR